ELVRDATSRDITWVRPPLRQNMTLFVTSTRPKTSSSVAQPTPLEKLYRPIESSDRCNKVSLPCRPYLYQDGRHRLVTHVQSVHFRHETQNSRPRLTPHRAAGPRAGSRQTTLADPPRAHRPAKSSRSLRVLARATATFSQPTATPLPSRCTPPKE